MRCGNYGRLLMAVLLFPVMIFADTWTDSETGITWSYVVSDGKATLTLIGWRFLN